MKADKVYTKDFVTLKEGDPLGKFYEKDAMLLRINVGEATDGTGVEYELTNSIDRSMLVKSKKTGRTFHMQWSDVISIAIERGVNQEPA